MNETLQLGGIVCIDCLKTLQPLGRERFNEAIAKRKYGYIYTVQPLQILECGTIVSTEKCTRCNYEKVFEMKPHLHQRHKQSFEIVSTKEIIEKRNDIPLFTEYRTKLIPVGKPYLVHRHGRYGLHPVSRKHKNEVWGESE